MSIEDSCIHNTLDDSLSFMTHCHGQNVQKSKTPKESPKQQNCKMSQARFD